MNVNTATSLLKALSIHRTQNKPLKDQLYGLFVPTLFGEDVVLRSTLRGRVTAFLSQRIGEKTQKEKVRRVFVKALETLEKNQVRFQGLASTIIELDGALKAEGLRKHDYQLPLDVELPTETETESLSKSAENRENINKLKILETSFLHDPTIRNAAINDAAILSVMKGQYTPDSFAYLQGFIRANEVCVREDYHSLLEQICIAKIESDQWKDAFLAGNKNLNALAQEWKEKVQSLNAGEPFLFCGGYGQRIGSLNSIFRAIRQIPDAVRKGLPKPFPNLLEESQLPDPVQFAKKELHEALTELFTLPETTNNDEYPISKETIEHILKILSTVSEPFFENEERKLPWLLAKIIPNAIGTPLEKWLKEGLLKQISPFVQEKSWAELLDWIASNRNTFLSEKDRNGAIQELEDRIARQFKGPVDGVMQKVDTSLMSLLHSFQKNIPTALLETIGLDSLFSAGDLWIELIKQENGKMTMQVYASGPALDKHPKSSNGKQISWPLRFENIEPERLDENFYLRLLHYSLEPLKNPETLSRAENIYEGVFQYLNAKPVDNRNNRTNFVQNLKGELSVTMAALVKPAYAPELLTFEMKLEALVNYCRPLIADENSLLEIKTEEEASKIESAMQLLWEEAQGLECVLGEHGLYKISVTRNEIMQALSKFKEEHAKLNIVLPNNALVIPRSLLEYFQTLLSRTGLTVDSIRNIKGALCWALGEEIESLVDTVVNSLEQLPASSIPKLHRKPGFIKKVITNIYVVVLWNALQAAWFIHKLYTGEATGFLLATWIHWGLKKILPKPFYDWYVIVIDTVSEQIFKGVLWMVLRALMSKNEVNELVSMARKWRWMFKNWTKSLNATQQVEFGYDPKIFSRDTTSLPQGESKIAIGNKVASSEATYLLPSITPITTLNEAVARLAKCKAAPEKFTTEYFIFLLNTAEQLAIPTQDSYWKDLESKKVRELLDDLTDLAVHLHNGLPHVAHHPELTSRTIVAMYNTLAITDSLARRREEAHLDGYTINAYPFLSFIKGHGVHLSSPEMQKKVRDICAYFMPDIDIDKLPDDPYTDPAVKKGASAALFDYSGIESFSYMWNSDNLPEARYLNERLNKGRLEKRLQAIGVPSHAKNRTKLNVLFNESLVFNRKQPIVPRAFSHLKLHTLLANRVVLHMGSDKQLPACTVKSSTAEVPSPQSYKDGLSFNSFFRECYELFKGPTNHSLISEKHPNKNSSFYHDPTLTKAFNKGLRNQSEIIIASESTFPLYKKEDSKAVEISKALESIFVEKDDQAMRFLGFLDKYGADLPADTLMNEPLESALFGFGILEKQLARAPNTANVLARCLQEQFERQFAAKRYNWCLWLVKINLKLQKFVDQNQTPFPDAVQQLNRVIEAQDQTAFSPIISTALQLKALTYPDNPKDLDPEKLQEGVVTHLRAMFYPKQIDDKNAPFLYEFFEHYAKWLETIQDAFDVEQTAHSICSILLNDRFIKSYPVPEHDPVFEEHAPYILHLGKLQFNLQTGSIDGPENFLLDNYIRIRKAALEIVPEAKGLVRLEDHYENPEGTIRIKTDLETDTLNLSKTLTDDKYNHLDNAHRNKFYQYREMTLPDTLLPLANYNQEDLKKAKCWLEIGPGNKLSLLIEIPHQPAQLIPVKVNSNKTLDFTFFDKEQTKLKSVGFEKFKHHLSPLMRFCAAKDILGWAKEKSSQLESLYFKPYKLHFQAHTADGKLTFQCSSHFPNYHIAPQQRHVATEGFGSYLLLQNDNEDFKVLLSEGEWITSAVSGILPKLGLEGSLARGFEKWVGSLQQKHAQGPQNFYTYDIDADGKLYSEDPKALLYLICQYLIQGKEELAEASCTELLRLVHLKRSSIELSDLLLYLSIVPANVASVSRIRRRIFAAIEENHTLYGSPPVENDPNESSQTKAKRIQYRSLIYINACLSDLTANKKEVQSRFKLPEEHEWYLYQHLFGHMKNLIEKGLELPSAVVNNLDACGWDTIMLSLGLSTDLARRYTVLRKKRKKDGGLVNKSLRVAAKSFRLGSILPSMNVMGSGMAPLMAKDVLNIAKTAVGSLVFNTKPLDFKLLAKEMDSTILPTPSLNAAEVDRNKFITHFVSYFALAKGKGTKEQKKAFVEFLKTINGGWDETTAVLVNYLEAVRKAPRLYPNVEKLQEVLKLEKEEVLLSDLKKDMDSKIHANPPLNAAAFDSKQFISHFLSYYVIAKEGNEGQKRALTAFIAGIPGPHDEQTASLIHYLKEVANSPAAYPDKRILERIIKGDKEKERVSSVKKFFELLSFRATYLTYARSAMHLTGHVGYHFGHKFIKESLGVPSLFWLNLTAQATSSAANAIYSEVVDGRTPETATAPATECKYDSLENIDTYIDKSLDEIVSKAFNSVTTHEIKKKIEKFESKNKINESLDAYNKEVDKPTTKYQFKGEKALWDMYRDLSGFRDFITEKADEQLKVILKFANSKISTDKVTFADLKKALIQDKLPQLCADLGLNKEEIALIETAIMRNAVLQTRLNQINRTMSHFEKLSSIDTFKEPQKYIETLNNIVKEAKARREYSFKDLPNRLLRRYVFFELLTNTMLWLRQINPISTVLSGEDGDYMILLLMAMGKTFFGIPTIGSHKADGEHIVFYTSPDTLAETSTRQISRQGNAIYDQSTNVFPVHRSSQRNIHHMEAINNLLGRALTQKETINLVMSEAQSLEANFIDLLYAAKRMRTDDPEILLSQELHKSALHAIKKRGVIIGDEGHILNQPDKELNHPLGRSYTIKKSYQIVVDACMQQIIKNKNFLKAIKENNLKEYAKGTAYQEIAKAAATELSKLWIFNLDKNKQEDFIEYVTGTSTTIPSWIHDHEKYEEICMAKGTLSTLMPMLFSQDINRNYGRSKNKYAGPFAGNMNPNEKFDIQLCYENLIKTYTTYLHTGLEDVEAAELLLKLFDVADEEQKRRSISFHETLAYSLLKKMLPADLLAEIHPDCAIEIKRKAIKALQENPDACLLYIRFFVANTIRFWNRCNMTDAQNFFSMFKNRINTTGTNYNEGSNHRSLQKPKSDEVLKKIKPPEITGEALQLLSQKCDDKDIHILQSDKPLELLKEVLSTYFKTPTFSMLLDGDAQLKGLDNETVAQVIEEHCIQHRKEIKAIVYYTRLNGKDQLVCREIGAKIAYPFDQCKIKPEHRITYIDENHDYGTNVPQSGSMFLLYGEQPLFRFVQQAFRMRFLIKTLSLFLNSELLDMAKKSLAKEQKIHIGMTKATQDRIVNDANRTPTLHEIINDSDNNEDKLVRNENYRSYRKQLRDIVRSAIMTKLEECKSIKEVNKMYPEFEDFLAPVIPNDPSKLFGLLETEIDTETALRIDLLKNYSVIEKSTHFSQNEKEAVLKELLDLHKPPMPAKVRAFTDGKNFDINTLDNLGSLMAIENSIEQNVNHQVNINVQTSDNTPSKFVETEWASDIDYSDLRWLKFKKADSLGKISSFIDSSIGFIRKKTRKNPYLFRFFNGIKNSDHKAIRKLSPMISKRLWFTNNFVPRILQGIQGEPIDVCSKYQRELYQVLVVLNKTADGYTFKSMGALSQQDAKFWRERLSTPGAEENLLVYDIPSRTIVAGNTKLENPLKNNAAFLRTEVQMKFLNGDDTYQNDQKKALTTWLEENKENLDILHDAFHLIHDQRNTKTTAGTDIETIFNDLRNIPAEYRI